MRIFCSVLLSILSLVASAVTMDKVRFFNEESDTTKITKLLVDCKANDFKNPQQRVAWLGRQFLGLPYVAHTLEASPEAVTVNLDQLDCTTFVETVLALAYTIGENRTSWRDFVHNLERMRYRNGVVDGYSSRLHYISDWIVNNSFRGNFVEATTLIPQHDYIIKTIDFMSRNRSLYPALKDSVEYEKIKNIEIGYRSHRYPYVKWTKLNSKDVRAALQEGDIVALTTTNKDLDVSHLGIIVLEKDGLHLMHASSVKKKVIVDPLPLYDYFKKSRSLTGLRVIRLER